MIQAFHSQQKPISQYTAAILILSNWFHRST